MKVALFANGMAGIYALETFASEFGKENIFLVTPFEGKVKIWHESVLDFAKSKNLGLVYSPKDVNCESFVSILREFNPKLIVSVLYNQILKENILSIPTLGSINVHPSLLPKYRGVAPLIFTIIEGEKETGVTIHYMNVKVDSGEIILQRRLYIDDTDTGYTLHMKSAELIKLMLFDFIELLKKGTLSSYPQQGESSYYSYKDCNRNKIDWNLNSEQIYNLVRALTYPLEGAYTFIGIRKYYILWGNPSKQMISMNLKPGDIFLNHEKKLVSVQTGQGFFDVSLIDVSGCQISEGNLFHYFCNLNCSSFNNCVEVDEGTLKPLS